MAQDGRLIEEQNTARRAHILNMQYIDTTKMPNRQLYLQFLSVTELHQSRMIPLTVEQKKVVFGVTNTTSQATMKQIAQRFSDYQIEFALISDAGYRDYMLLYDPPKKVVYEDINIKDTATDEGLVQRVSRMLLEIRPDDMLAYLVEQAHNLNASDIHIEAQRNEVRLRFRIDGVLHPIGTLNHDRYRTLLGVIASAGNISSADPDAQQGHISQDLKMADGRVVKVNVRLETVPTVNGVDVVMRLFNMDQDSYSLDRLGLTPEERADVDAVIEKPSGLVLVVGPTGSGKTTTMYSILNTLNSEERKIITIEDPVEYQFAGISQIPVDTNAAGNDGSFASKLRAVLRLDPDIVMVGEIRDNETAKTALQASMTGHLVLSTFHASSAAAALVRMEEIIGKNPLFVSAIRLVMGQRLVRKLDDALKIQRDPTEVELRKIYEVVSGFPESVAKPNLEGLKLYDAGTSPENPYGYSGRIVLREQFRMTNTVRNLLENPPETLTAQQLEAAASKDGMLTMEQKGILKVIAGETTLEEVYRVVG
ncbi:Flp pilus assembly complex ATPase component TadA [Candidatus Saccharibacteria bacterium]|nr:Flp pilus assembly complex ATPase component TadA [Candidatus Saccharibacteria bacterium]